MFGFLRKKKKEPRNLRELFESKAKEIESSAWISTAVLTVDGLKVFLKKRSEAYNVEKLLPYALRLFQSALKFHEKAHPGLKIGSFEPPRTLIYQMDTREIVFVVKGFSKKANFFIVYVADPELSSHFSIDETAKKLHSWTYRISKEIDQILKGKKNEA
jgi:hypothetical protein